MYCHGFHFTEACNKQIGSKIFYSFRRLVIHNTESSIFMSTYAIFVFVFIFISPMNLIHHEHIIRI